MFQPQPTPFAAAAFASYGVGQDLFAPTPLVHSGPPPLVYHDLRQPTANYPHSYNQGSQPAAKMDPDLDDDVAAQQAAAREYQPELEGPLVGEKTTSDAITEEYAKADQVYINKTIALPHTYSHYRPIQGDGNCGWRAIGFSYFETMICVFNKQQIEAEVQRMSNLNQYILTAGGYDISLFEDMVEETITLLKELADAMPNRDVAMAILMERFNDRACSNAIIYHLRLLASSWLKENAALFEPFIPDDTGIPGYCQDCIERPDKEIEHLGIELLTNVLLKPVGFVLEIAYLDRSPGTQVNIYRFPPEANGQDEAALGPIIYLLFRPDHYDILYKIPHKPVEIQVHKVTSFKHKNSLMSAGPELDDFAAVDFSPLALMPGLSHGSFPPPPGMASSVSEPFLPSPQSPWDASSFSETIEPEPAMPPPPTTQPPAPAPAPQPAASPITEYPVRFSREMQRLTVEPFPEPIFTTNMFKNSHFNKAHYNNPDFHPEEWTPDDDDRGGHGRRRLRCKQE